MFQINPWLSLLCSLSNYLSKSFSEFWYVQTVLWLHVDIQSQVNCFLKDSSKLLEWLMWQPGWDGNSGDKGYICMSGWVPSLFTWDYHDIVHWLYSSTKWKALKKSFREAKRGFIPMFLLKKIRRAEENIKTHTPNTMVKIP